MLEDPIVAGLASAYFLATFLFGGYVLRVYLQVREELRELEERLDTFKYLEEQLDAMSKRDFHELIGGGEP